MGRNIISAKLDIIFKKIFCENVDLLHEFIADMLDIPSESIKEIKIKNTEMLPESPYGKFSRLDLSLQVDDSLVNVEIQLKSENDFSKRTMFYWAKLYTSELKSGDEYGQLKKAIIIDILNFNMFKTDNYHQEVVPIVKETGEVFSPDLDIHFFELKKVNRKPNPNKRQELWLQFLNAEDEEELEMLKDTNVPVIKKAVNVIYDMSEDTRIRELARMREKALHDKASELAQAKMEGRAEGREEGRAEGRAEGHAEGRAEGEASIIERMRKSGMTEEQIQAILNIG